MKLTIASVPANFSALHPQKISMQLSALWADALNFWGQAWWVEVLTSQPQCTYYFGPFVCANEAKAAIPGYIADLEGEAATGIDVRIKRCKPDPLTIDEVVREFEIKPIKQPKIVSSFL